VATRQTKRRVKAREEVAVSTYLSLGRDAHQSLSIVGEGNGRGSGSLTLSIFNNLSIVSFHHCDAGVGGAQINTDDPEKRLEQCAVLTG